MGQSCLLSWPSQCGGLLFCHRGAEVSPRSHRPLNSAGIAVRKTLNMAVVFLCHASNDNSNGSIYDLSVFQSGGHLIRKVQKQKVVDSLS